MKICVLGSGSSGNCIYIEQGSTRVLVDAGLSLRETEARLRRIGSGAEAIKAVCISHEHSDHVRGVAQLQRRHQVPVFTNGATADALEQLMGMRGIQWTLFPVGSTFQIEALSVTSFSIPHDASDTVGFIVDDGRKRLGIATDLGIATEAMKAHFMTCDALILESNHDVDMLRSSPRPWSLKSRISGRHGHLSNEASAALLCELCRAGRLKSVFLAHLSEDCNTPEVALREIELAMTESFPNGYRLDLRMTYRARISDLLDLDLEN